MRAVVFDLDGTLADTYDLIVHAFNVAMAPYWKRTWSRAEVRSLFGPTEEVILRGQLPAAQAEAAIARLFETYESEHERLARVFPGTMEAVAALYDDGFRIGVLTNKGRRSADISLQRLGLSPYVTAVVSGDDAPAKPDPQGLKDALRTLGAAPENAVMVGDAPSDIIAGHAAGCQAIGVTWAGTYPDERLQAVHPEIIVDAPSELERAIRSLFS